MYKCTDLQLDYMFSKVLEVREGAVSYSEQLNEINQLDNQVNLTDREVVRR